MQESKSQSYFTASSQIITFFLLNKQQRGRVERTSASRNLRKTFGKEWSYISELLLALRTICLDNFSFQYRNNPPKLHAPSLIERIGNAPIFLHSPCATQVKIDWGKFSKTAREENFWGGEKWRRSKHTPVMRYPETRRDEGKGGGGRYAGTRGGPDLGARTGASPVSMGTGTLTWKTISRGVSHRRHSGIDLFDHLAWLNGACPPFTAFSFNENNHRGSWPPNPPTPLSGVGYINSSFLHDYTFNVEEVRFPF